MSTLVLVGDSVFANAAYVNGPDVRDQIETKMPDDWAVSLLAVDGSYIFDVQNQLEQLPGDAQILVVSTGGNDVLVQTEVLNDAVTTVGEALLLLGDAVGQFREDYCRMLEAVVATDVQSYICTIYRPDFPDEEFQRMTSTALGLFNGIIVEEAPSAYFLSLISGPFLRITGTTRTPSNRLSKEVRSWPMGLPD